MRERDGLRLLVVAPFAPRIAATDGGSRVMGELVTRLAERHELAVLYLREGGNPGVDDAVREACARVEEHAFAARNRAFQRVHSLAGLAVARPRWASHLSARGFGRRLRDLVDEWQPDAIQLEFDVMGHHLRALPRHRPPVVLVQHDPGMATAAEQHATHPGRGWRRVVSRADVAAWKRHERRALEAVDAVVVFTAADRETMARVAPPGLPIETIPFGISPLPRVADARERSDTVLFVGSFVHPPNVDAAMRLVTGIHPRLHGLRPGARLVVVGEQPPPGLVAAASDSVEITGRVPSVAPYLAEAAVVVVPVRLGGGMRVKVQEAFAAGKAVVSTSRALAGMSVRDGEHVVVAESDEEFAVRTAELLGDEARRQAIGRAARAWAATHLGWPGTIDRYEQLYARLLGCDRVELAPARAGGDGS
jgi:glycosyltransferase involved in cell wall biosynthesis